jgi:uracil-DNA glycosylase family 4
MTNRQELADHLKVFADMGVNGVSRDASWRQRASALPAAGAGAELAPDASPDLPIEPEGHGAAAPAVPVPVASATGATAGSQADALVALRADIGDCTRCKLHTLGRHQVVFGKGNPNADLMFVGEAPGADEDIKGEPFVGRAGELLTKIIGAIDLTREDVYIANVIKCRPPGNRNPEPDEVATCSPFLLRQIELIRPKVIVALGTFAAQALLQTKTPITKLRGQVLPFRGGDVKVIPTFHPSFLLRNQKNRDLYRDVWNDMKQARALITAAD